jgi:hypothetical protein
MNDTPTTDEFYRLIGLDPKRMRGLYPVLEAILDGEDEE